MSNPEHHKACCAGVSGQHPDQSLALTSESKSLFFSETFIAASYFIAMLASFSGFSALLPLARVAVDSATLFSIGVWGINLITLCVMSFLFYSESQANLRRFFSGILQWLLFSYMVTLWWPLSQLVMSSEWSLVLSICGAITLIWLRYYCQVQAKTIFNAMIFIMSALMAHSGLTLLHIPVSGLELIALSLIFSALTLFLAFSLNQVSEKTLANKDRQAVQHILFLLSLSGNYGAVYFILI